MTSKRSYRDPIPQQKVREQILEGMGSQFDPQYAKIMLHMIDQDIEYGMREHQEESDDAFITRIKCQSIYNDCSTGIPVTDYKVRIHCYSRADDGFPKAESIPTILLFDALDARVHLEEAKQKELLYFEYAQLRFDGKTCRVGARKLETRIKPCEGSSKSLRIRASPVTPSKPCAWRITRSSISRTAKRRWKPSSRCRTAPGFPTFPSPASIA